MKKPKWKKGVKMMVYPVVHKILGESDLEILKIDKICPKYSSITFMRTISLDPVYDLTQVIVNK